MSKKKNGSEACQVVPKTAGEVVDISYDHHCGNIFDLVKRLEGEDITKMTNPRPAGLGFEYQIEDDDDAYEDVDDSDDEYSESDYCYSDYDPDYALRSTYCGFPRVFLDPNYMPTGLDMNLPFNYKMGVTAEEAEKNGKELVDEEQRVAQKAEKKRLKKKRQKERKRQEKLEKINQNEASCLAEELLNVNIANSDEEKNISNKKEASMLSAKRPTESSEKHKEINGNESSNEDDGKKEDSPEEESEDELDLTSTFVSKAASIAKRKMELKPKSEKKEKKKKPEKDTEVKEEIQENGNEDNGAIHARSFEQADIGNQLASSGRFEVAVTYFTNAIKFNPKEYKLFGNRSFCYERLMQYDKALNDAEISLSLCPSWTKGYFRKGKALAGLQRYAEAEVALKEVLNLDSTCADAEQELMRVQIIQLMEMGFTREQSTDALIMYGTVHKALEALSNIHAGNGHAVEEEWIVSGKKGHSAAKSVPRPQIPQTTQLKPVLQPRTAQANIQLGEQPIWVGNVTNSISPELLKHVFSTAGPINSVKMLYDRRCAFVNYSNKEAAERAIQTLQDLEIEGTKLLIRYPDHSYKNQGRTNLPSAVPGLAAAQTAKPLVLGKPVGECFFWRMTGCTKKVCPYKHIPEHKGIDRQKK
ncbi:tetratricopeptide repeat protein 31-like isoform X1 [Acipenser ruthenus]|uniref:tetratricopeptide repeat protein 31-like isoform X1 n=1 Tax=Acipenser ruthenus TaxID=7906 RepID=UPI001561532B|nr:tetratricopeptide repeat protein 31-like isoform X1 [Acipenser ruthenus]